MSEQDNVAIGIDLGTTYSCVGIWQNDRIEIIANDQGNRTTPSYVSFKDGERIIGDGAKTQAGSNPENTIFDIKRLIGRNFDDKTVQNDIKHFPFKVTSGKDKRPTVEIEVDGKPKKLQAEEVSAMILTKMKETAESYLGHSVKKAGRHGSSLF